MVHARFEPIENSAQDPSLPEPAPALEGTGFVSLRHPYLEGQALQDEMPDIVALDQTDDSFRMLSEYSPIGLFQMAASGKFLFANARLRELMTASDDRTVDELWETILGPRPSEVRDTWQKAWNSGQEFTCELPLAPIGREHCYVFVRACHVQASDEARHRVVGTIEDITEWKNTQRQLQVTLDRVALAHQQLESQAELLRKQNDALELAQARAEQASRSKSEFLANMSHEIRTPMTAIMGFVDILADAEDESLDDELRSQYLDTIKRNGDHLLSILNDILDLSKIEAGKLDCEYVDVQPVALIQDVIELMKIKAEAKNLQLRCELPKFLPKCFRSDPLRLRQILVNLIGNAIKFTELGEVAVQVRFELDSSPRILVSIHDTGIGMTESQIQRLFQAFEQADTSTTRRFGGTGLGLRISGRLARMLGGEITVTSLPGVGSSFTLSLPIEPPDSGLVITSAKALGVLDNLPAEIVDPDPLTGVRILLAEDGPDNQRLIAFYLRKAGAMVTVVEDGIQAVQALTIAGDLDSPLKDPLPFDFVITDMLMPRMDGYRAVRFLREKGLKLPIIALTANAMRGDQERSLAAGCTHFTSKPIDRVSLMKICLAAAKCSLNYIAPARLGLG